MSVRTNSVWERKMDLLLFYICGVVELCWMSEYIRLISYWHDVSMVNLVRSCTYVVKGCFMNWAVFHVYTSYNSQCMKWNCIKYFYTMIPDNCNRKLMSWYNININNTLKQFGYTFSYICRLVYEKVDYVVCQWYWHL